MKDEKKINALTSEKFTGITVKKSKKKAAGLPAVLIAAQHGIREMGLLRSIKTLFKVNQTDGFDCPGCAWPDPEPGRRSGLGEYCENGVKAVAEEATRKKADAAFFQKYSVAELSNWSDYELGKSGRLTEPMILREGSKHYEPISWEEAFQIVAGALNKLDHPDEAVFYTSGRASNEAAFSYQLFVREFGTNNLPDCSNMCHESSGTALSEVLGIGKGSVTLKDFYHSELILVVGQNPGTNHPRMLSALSEAKANGAKIVSVNPLKETGLMGFIDPQSPLEMVKGGTELTDIYLQIRINQDVCLFKALMKILLEAERANPGTIFDVDFIEKETVAYEELVDDLDTYDLDELIEQTGIPKEQILETAEFLKARRRIIICWAMGLTQHKNSVEVIREVVNLLLLKGSVGIQGGGTCPVRGHSNVQGNRTVGIWEKPPKFLLDGIESRFGFRPPEQHGYNVVEAIQAMHEEKVKVFFALGGNFLSATPDTELTAEALQNCEMTVQVSTKLNRSHLITGKTALILPCKARSEKDEHDGIEQIVSVENSTGLVHTSRGGNKPAADTLLSETQIICRLAQVVNPDSKVNYGEMERNFDVIRDHIEAIIPGFDNYNERVRKTGGFYLPNPSREGRWSNDIKKAKFTINKQTEHQLAEDELMMMTIRSHDQYNTTIYGLDDRYRGIYNERRVILMHEKDLEKFRLKHGDVVNLSSHYDGIERKAPRFIALKYDIPQGCVATYFPEANPLVPVSSVADRSHTPTSKSIRIKVGKVGEKVEV